MTQFSSLYGGRLDRELGTDDSTTLFTTARRKAAVNEAAEEWAIATKCLQRRLPVTIVGGTAEYDLNASPFNGAYDDFIEFAPEQVQFRYTDASSNVTVLAGDDLPQRQVEWLNRYVPGWQVSTVASSVMQLPSVYYQRIDGNQRLLGFWPTPSTGSSASAVAYVTYVARPTPMTSDTQQPFTDVLMPLSTAVATYRADLRPYHQALVHHAAHNLEKLRRDDQASDRQLQKFLSFVARYLAGTRIKNGTSLTFVRNYFTRRADAREQDPRT